MKSILFIDDDEIVAKSFDLILSDLNYSVTTCLSSTEGLNLALLKNFDLIITDLRMPELSGIELIQSVKKQKPNSKIYLLTAFLDDDILKSALSAGASGIMEKPFKVSKIISIMSYS